jgi:hypothetical protein
MTNEDDTFRKLKRAPFNIVKDRLESKFFFQDLGDVPKEFFDEYNWEVQDFINEYIEYQKSLWTKMI